MNLQSIIKIIQTYPFVDIERTGGIMVRKHIETKELTEELIRSYVEVYGEIIIVPKRKTGNAFVRTEGENMTINRAQLPAVGGLNGFDQPVMGNENGMYKVFYEQAKQENRDLQARNESLLSELRKLEVEYAGNKNSALGAITQGLAGIAPMFLNSSAAPLAGIQQQPAQQALPATTPIQDKRLVGIIQFYQKQDDPTKSKIYELLCKVFANLDGIDEVIGLIN